MPSFHYPLGRFLVIIFVIFVVFSYFWRTQVTESVSTGFFNAYAFCRLGVKRIPFGRNCVAKELAEWLLGIGIHKIHILDFEDFGHSSPVVWIELIEFSRYLFNFI